MWTILKVFTEFVTISLLFYVLIFWHAGSELPRPGIEPVPPALEGKVLTTAQPRGVSTIFFLIKLLILK